MGDRWSEASETRKRMTRAEAFGILEKDELKRKSREIKWHEMQRIKQIQKYRDLQDLIRWGHELCNYREPNKSQHSKIQGEKEEDLERMKIVQFLIEFFSSSDVQQKSGVPPGSKSHYIPSIVEIRREIKNRFNLNFEVSKIVEVLKSYPIEVLGDTGYGNKTRQVQVVRFGSEAFALNTESNTREALRRYFNFHGYKTFIEVNNNTVNVAILACGDLSQLELHPNTIDLVAVKDATNNRTIWLVEIKGHSGVENWDFFTGLKQLLKLLDMRQRLLQESGKELEISVKCAFAVPGFAVKAHNGNYCYAKELDKIANIYKNPDLYQQFIRKKTYESLVEAIEKYDFLRLLRPEEPTVHLLIVKGERSVIDFISKEELENIL